MREITFADRLAVVEHVDSEHIHPDGSLTIEGARLIDAVRCCGEFPECSHVLAWVESQRPPDAETLAAIAACPTPVYHETHRYCPSCPWTEQIEASSVSSSRDGQT